jgi:predicted SprT family Zn-dependent metalloprotease
MNARWDKFLKRLVNYAMAHYLRFAGKMRADHRKREMSAAFIASMAGMLCAVVHNFEQLRLQHRQAAANFVL